MSSEAHTGAARAILGSVTDAVVRNATRPVLVLRGLPHNEKVRWRCCLWCVADAVCWAVRRSVASARARVLVAVTHPNVHPAHLGGPARHQRGLSGHRVRHRHARRARHREGPGSMGDTARTDRASRRVGRSGRCLADQRSARRCSMGGLTERTAHARGHGRQSTSLSVGTCGSSGGDRYGAAHRGHRRRGASCRRRLRGVVLPVRE